MTASTSGHNSFSTPDLASITGELERRSSRPAAFEIENHAVSRLLAKLGEAHEGIWQELAETIREICGGDSAGVSLVESGAGDEPAAVSWVAVAGPLGVDPEASILTDHSPAKAVIERNSLTLFNHPFRKSVDGASAGPPVFEALFVPFHFHGRPVGTICAISHSKRHTFDSEDARLLTSLSRIASTAYQLKIVTGEASDARDSLNSETTARMQELAEVRRLQETSTRLIAKGNVDALLDEIQDAALAFTRTDTGTMQLLDPETGKLRLLRSRGFPREMSENFQQVGPDEDTTCSQALKHGRRVIAADMETSPIFAGTRSGELHRQIGLRAAQSTPLVSRSGAIVGMLTTHWRHPHHPTEHELHLLDVLTRQAADLIERCQAEEALRKSETNLRELSRTLEKQVADRTHELEEKTTRLRTLANELASAEHRERKRLAALLHDHLQQLLAAANMQIGILQQRFQGSDLTTLNDLGEWLREAADAARDLTQQLRPPALYEDGLVPALKWLASEMKTRQGLTVTLETDGAGRALADDTKALLFECVRELLFNVAKYAELDTATVRMHETNERLQLTVADEGKGFDVAVLAGDSTVKTYGLFSIRERLVALGGDLKLESAPGMGTKAELEVPLEKSENGNGHPPQIAPFVQTESDVSERRAVSTNGRICVFVVDDHAMVREGIANILANDERLHVIGQAADGIQAVEEVKTHKPEVVLLDINMPRQNGIETAREIARIRPNTVIIGLSVQDDEAVRQTMLDAGAVAYLPKAGAPEEMIETILACAEKARRA